MKAKFFSLFFSHTTLTVVAFLIISTFLSLSVVTLLQRQEQAVQGNKTSGNVLAAINVPAGGSISSAVNAAQPGDVITIAGGTYNEQLTIAKSGSAGKYITLQANPGEKVILTGGTLKITNQSYIKLIGITVKGSNSFGAYIDSSNNLVFQNFEVDTSQDGGLVILASSNIVVDGCDIHGTNSRGLSANHEALSIGEGSSNFEIKNCKVYNNGEEGIDAKYNPNANGSIHDNTVWNNRGPNIYVDSSNGVKLYNNTSYGTTEGSKAGIAIAAETAYTGSNNPRKASNIDIYNNVSYGNAGGGINFYTEPGGTISDVRIYNNTVVNNSKNAIVMASSALSGSNPVFNNIFSGNSVGGGTGLQMGSNLTVDAKFVSTTDFHLQTGSPAIDKGTAAGAPAFDRDNKTRPSGSAVDMGAYEYGAVPGPSGTSSPTFGVIAPCPSCVGPSITQAPSGVVPGIPSGGVNPSTVINNPNPTNPCSATGASLAHDKKKSKHNEHKGVVSGFMEMLLKFFMELINLLLKLFGGGQLPVPGPQPSVSPSPMPCSPGEEPIMSPAPSVQQPTGPVSGQPLPSITLAPTTSNSNEPFIPYSLDSFFRNPLPANAPIDAKSQQGITFLKTFSAQQSSKYPNFPVINGLGSNKWGTVYFEGKCSDPIWKLTGTVPADATFLTTEGFHAPVQLGETFTGTSDSPFVVMDRCGVPTMPSGFSVWAANAAKAGTNTISVSAAGAFQHDSNGLDKRNPRSNSTKNFRSRGAIPDAMVIRKDRLEWAITNNTDLGYVLHMFFVETNTADGFVHPMIGAENGKAGFGAEGLRIKVKANVDLTTKGLSPGGLAVARTLQKHGAYLGDNSGSGTSLKAEQNYGQWGNLLAEDALKGLTWDDFEFVQAGYEP